MHARELEAAAETLERKRRQVVHAFVAAVTVAAVAIAIGPSFTRIGLVLGIGAAFEVLLACAFWFDRRELIERLALDPAAYVIPAVASFGSRVAALRERERLAAWIRSVACEPERPGSFHLPDRARAFAREFETVAQELARPTATVQAPVAVACRRLLTRPVQSPLYNPNLPEEDLAALLRRIRAGIAAPPSVEDQ
jgi:hypothetical protein